MSNTYPIPWPWNQRRQNEGQSIRRPNGLLMWVMLPPSKLLLSFLDTNYVQSDAGRQMEPKKTRTMMAFFRVCLAFRQPKKADAKTATATVRWKRFLVLVVLPRIFLSFIIMDFSELAKVKIQRQKRHSDSIWRSYGLYDSGNGRLLSPPLYSSIVWCGLFSLWPLQPPRSLAEVPRSFFRLRSLLKWEGKEIENGFRGLSSTYFHPSSPILLPMRSCSHHPPPPLELINSGPTTDFL